MLWQCRGPSYRACSSGPCTMTLGPTHSRPGSYCSGQRPPTLGGRTSVWKLDFTLVECLHFVGSWRRMSRLEAGTHGRRTLGTTCGGNFGNSTVECLRFHLRQAPLPEAPLTSATLSSRRRRYPWAPASPRSATRRVGMSPTFNQPLAPHPDEPLT